MVMPYPILIWHPRYIGESMYLSANFGNGPGVVLLIAKVSIFVLATTFIVMGVLQATRSFSTHRWRNQQRRA